MNYGLKDKTLQQLQAVLRRHPEVEEAILYGSRAKGNYRPGSDIDLTLKGTELTLQRLNAIERELDDLLLPYEIDLSNYHSIENPELLDHIKRVGVALYTKSTY